MSFVFLARTILIPNEVLTLSIFKSAVAAATPGPAPQPPCFPQCTTVLANPHRHACVSSHVALRPRVALCSQFLALLSNVYACSLAILTKVPTLSTLKSGAATPVPLALRYYQYSTFHPS